MSRAPRPRPTPFGQDRAAVSDVLGGILLVGMTVIAAVGFGAMLFAFEGPADLLRVDLNLRTDPGTGGWGTGDEVLQVLHQGGEAITDDGVTIRYTLDGVTRCFGAGTGCAALGSAFSDGQLTIGETWEAPALPPPGLESDTELDVQVSFRGDSSQLLAAGLVAGSTVVPASVSCIVDDEPPTSSFSVGDLDTTDGTSPFLVTLVADDECNPVDTDSPPSLHYRVTPLVTGVPDEYTDLGSDLGPMTWVNGVGFQKNIPAPSGLGWANAYGRTVEFYASALVDTAPTPNSADTAVDTEFVELIGSQSDPPDTLNLVAGAFTTAGPASNLNTDNGANAILQEACMLDQPTLNVQNLCGRDAGGVSVTNAANARFSDNVRSSHSGSNSYVEVYGFDVPGDTGDVNSFTVVWEGSRASGSGAPTLAIEVNFGPDYSATSSGWKQVGSVSPGTSEGTALSAVLAGGVAGGPWQDTQFDSLHVRARVNNGGTKAVSTDDLHIRPTYPSSSTVYDVLADFVWTGLDTYAAASDIRQLSIQYQVTSPESYILEVANDAGGNSFTTCWTLNSATLATPSPCSLTAAQVALGPWVRIRQAATSDTTGPNSLQMDYLHMLVVT